MCGRTLPHLGIVARFLIQRYKLGKLKDVGDDHALVRSRLRCLAYCVRGHARRARMERTPSEATGQIVMERAPFCDHFIVQTPEGYVTAVDLTGDRIALTGARSVTGDCVPHRARPGARTSGSHSTAGEPAGRAAVGGGRSRLHEPPLSRARLGAWARDRPFRPSAMRPRWPARSGSTPTAISSSACRARLKEWRAVATRYEKTARSFMGVLCLAAAIDWIRR